MPPPGVVVSGPPVPGGERVLTDEALAFIADLQRRFGHVRIDLLHRRHERQAALDAGERLDFPAGTQHIRDADWTVAPAPPDFDDRRVEITGPAEPKMMINALNSGARVFMADLEDALSPTWANVVGGQAALMDAVRGTLTFDSPEGKSYRVGDRPAQLVVRPRGWHLVESHVMVDGVPMSASLFDAGLYLFHNAAERIARGSGPYLYLPKLESHHEARLWNEVFVWAQAELGVPRGSVRATVLIETITAAFEMDEILYELREHAAGLNAGRWDYLFSVIKRFRGDTALESPDRSQLTMTVPFMRAYTRAARADLPPPRGARDRRDGRVHPQPARPRGHRDGPRQGPRRQGAREPATGSMGRGWPTPTWCRSRPRSSTRCSASAEPEGSACATGAVTAAELLDFARRRRGSHRCGHPRQRPGRPRLPRRVAARRRAPPPSTTSWRTPRPPRSRARSCGSGERARPAELEQYAAFRDEELARLGGRHRRPAQGRLGDPRPPRARRRIRRVPDAARVRGPRVGLCPPSPAGACWVPAYAVATVPFFDAVPSELLAARSQMAFTLGFHIILACLGVGLPSLVLIANWIGLRRRDPSRCCSPAAGRRSWPSRSRSVRSPGRSSRSRWASSGRC